MTHRDIRSSFGRLALSTLVVAAGSLCLPCAAEAHFLLEAPESYMSQDILGNPQKAPPCGDDGTGTLTGSVTAFQQGQTITITINETIFHPGHYRVALALNDPSELPEEPPVTAGSTACGSTTIMDPPVFPVLADGMLVHDTAFSGPQSFDVTLPDNVTCDHCTLQVIEFMGNHGLNNPGGCFYHHCANISIASVPVNTGGAAGTAGTGGTSAAGSSGSSGSSGASGSSGSSGAAGAGGTESTGGTSGASASSPASSDDSGGCSVFAPGAAGMSGLASLAALAAVMRRRRRD